jgi:hypothetical protein
MWRVRWRNGRLTSPMNLPRAKDLAVAIAERGPPPRNPQRLHWKQERSERRSGGRRRVSPPAPLSSQPKFSKAERAWRVVAGPEVSEINLWIPLDPELAARQERTRASVEEHRQRAKRTAARKAMRIAPTLDLDPAPAVLHSIAPVFDDPFEIPAFLDRTRFAELEEAA